MQGKKRKDTGDRAGKNRVKTWPLPIRFWQTYIRDSMYQLDRRIPYCKWKFPPDISIEDEDGED